MRLDGNIIIPWLKKPSLLLVKNLIRSFLQASFEDNFVPSRKSYKCFKGDNFLMLGLDYAAGAIEPPIQVVGASGTSLHTIPFLLANYGRFLSIPCFNWASC